MLYITLHKTLSTAAAEKIVDGMHLFCSIYKAALKSKINQIHLDMKFAQNIMKIKILMHARKKYSQTVKQIQR